MNSNAFTLWLTGLPCSGKTTIAVEFQKAARCALLDGDLLRQSPLSEDLGFSHADRIKQARRTAYVAALLNAQNVNVIVALVSPMRAMRKAARDILGPKYKEIFVQCPPEVCARRDVKGMYAKARRGLLKGFTGFDADFEPPINPDLVLNTDELSLQTCVDRLLIYWLNET